MQFYVPAKYQNINDRIKRLHQQNTQKTATLNSQYQPPHKNISFNSQSHQITTNYKHNLKMNLNVKDYAPDWQSISHEPTLEQTGMTTPKQQLHMARGQNRPAYKLNLKGKHGSKGIACIMSTQLLNYQNNSQLMDYSKQQAAVHRKSQDEMSELPVKAMPVQSIKIQDILQSYNSYKQNKQKFIRTISKDTNGTFEQPKQCIRLSNCKEDGEQIMVNCRQKMLEPIDNTWGTSGHENKMSKIEKFKQRIMHNQQKSSQRQEKIYQHIKTQEDQDRYQEMARKPFFKPKLIFDNNPINLSEARANQQRFSLVGMNSPRMPGKIIKNIERNMALN